MDNTYSVQRDGNIFTSTFTLSSITSGYSDATGVNTIFLSIVLCPGSDGLNDVRRVRIGR